MKGDSVNHVIIPREVSHLQKVFLHSQELGYEVQKGVLQFPGPTVKLENGNF